MAGIYVHIPFCKTRCVYCGFFSTTSVHLRGKYVDAVVDELRERRSFLGDELVRSIYFGGGTPSQLPVESVETMLAAMHTHYNIYKEAEITLEGNPDDLTPVRLEALRRMGVNRLSMGVQTFDDTRLRFLCRRHSAEQARVAVHRARIAGFSNVSIDLMFGFPGQTLDEWRADLAEVVALDVPHISAYSLMYEEGTPLYDMLERGSVSETDDELAARMYECLTDTLTEAGYEHYELSNFARLGMRSRHNESYWRGVPYLGVGAGAHSYDGRNRFFHSDSLDDYFAGAPLVEERLSARERYDEFVFTALRTCDGLNLSALERRFGEAYKQYCLQNAQRHLEAGLLLREGDVLRLSRRGLFVSNDVMSDLMWVE